MADWAEEKARKLTERYGPAASASLRPASTSNAGIKAFCEGVRRHDIQCSTDSAAALREAERRMQKRCELKLLRRRDQCVKGGPMWGLLDTMADELRALKPGEDG